MIYHEPKAMREIHDIRLRLHEEKKGLSVIEKAEETNKSAEEIIKVYKLKVKLLHRVKSHTPIAQTA
jgi:hypothetical protein